MTGSQSSSRRARTRKKAIRGFTLVELMVVVAIIGILASIALPAYTEHVVTARRAAGAACLAAAQQQMERFYTQNLAYNATGSPVSFTCDNEAADHYTVTRTAVAAKTYTLSATPQGAQRNQDTKCGTLTINQAGAKTPTTPGCW